MTIPKLHEAEAAGRMSAMSVFSPETRSPSETSRTPSMRHIAGFSLDKHLCGAPCDPAASVGWRKSDAVVDCVVCVATWRGMTYAQRRALNIYWGGNES